MKKFLSLLLAIVMLASVFTCTTISVSAAQSVEFGKTYTYTYTDKNCKGSFVVPENGMVKVELVKPVTKYGSAISMELDLTKGSTSIISEKSLYDEVFYLFLDKGTYNFNFIDVYEYATQPLKYKFTFTKTYNNKVNPITWGETYTNHYNADDMYGSFSLKEAGTVTFDLTQPIASDGQTWGSQLHIYDENQNSKEILSEYFSSSNSYNTKYSVRLNKGNYKFNYSCSYVYAENEGLYVDEDNYISSTYKLTFKKAVAPKAPKIKQTVEKTNYYSFTRYDVKATFADNEAYDGVELWIKKNNGKWEKTDTAENSDYSRCNGFRVTVYSTDGYVVFYKVRAYTNYGSVKKYSAYSNTLYTKTSLKPKAPTGVAVKSISKKTAKVSWKKSSGVQGYEVYRSTKKSGSYKKIATIKKPSTVSYTNKSLSSNKTYYYKIRSYKTISGVKIYSNYSSPKSVRVK